MHGEKRTLVFNKGTGVSLEVVKTPIISAPFTNWAGDTHWYADGVLHREDGPAMLRGKKYRAWYFYGSLHRENGPALSGAIWGEWWIHGKRHREDGPAIEANLGMEYRKSHRWYIQGIEMSEEEHDAWREANVSI